MFEKEYSEKEVVEIILTDEMAGNIEIMGNGGVFELIEGFKNPKTRLAYRKYFLLAGGQIPESEI